jgi:aspartyl-tRNA(Asn)/glutamyl-tRNA(Gln) amidotransferase subunit A
VVPARLAVDPRCGDAYRTLSAPDVYTHVRDAQTGPDLHPTLRGYLDAATAVDADALADAHAVRAGLVAAVAEAFERFDLLLLPATQVPAFPAEGPMPTEIAGVPVDHWGSLAVTFPFNLTGHPAISVPAGTVGGVPVGLQIVGRRHSDALVLTAAAAVERISR